MTQRRALVFLGTLLFILAWHMFSRADDRWPQWNDAERLTLMKAVEAEISFRSEREATAIGYALVRQWRTTGRTMEQQIRAYCALWDKRSPRYYEERARQIREATFAIAPFPKYSGRWQRLRAWAERFGRRLLYDPCPGSWHFGGGMDVHRMGSRRVICVFGKKHLQYLWER